MIVIIFLMGFRLEALIWVTVFMALTSVVISFIFINKRLFAGIKNVKPEIEKEKLWRFSFPMYFNNLMDKTKMFFPIFLTGYFLSNEDIGIYNISFKIALLVSFSLGAFRDIFSPSISSLFAKGNKKLIEDLYKTVTKWVFSISLVSFFLSILPTSRSECTYHSLLSPHIHCFHLPFGASLQYSRSWQTQGFAL